MRRQRLLESRYCCERERGKTNLEHDKFEIFIKWRCQVISQIYESKVQEEVWAAGMNWEFSGHDSI